MILYTCVGGKSMSAAHPCGKAAKALDDAGHTYDWRKVKGGSLKPWTWASRAQDRAEVERVSGQRSVPVLVLDDDKVITGSGEIVRWAREHQPAPTT